MVRRDEDVLGRPATHIVLQHRGPYVHNPNTWSIPGGALDKGESYLQAALREGMEEVQLSAKLTEGDNPLLVVRESVTLTDHGAWKYVTIIVDVIRDFEPKVPPGDAESLAVEWVPLDEVTTRKLHPAFRDAWPTLREMITRQDRPTTASQDDDAPADGEEEVDT